MEPTFEDLKLLTTHRILHPKISLNSKFQRFIPFSREIINISLIFGGILGLNGHVTSQMAHNFEDLKLLTTQSDSTSQN